jgi:adenylate cyclase
MTTMEAPPLERKLVAILAADVEGYLGEHTVRNNARPVRVFRVKFDPNATSPQPVSEPADAKSSMQLTDMDAVSEGRGADPVELEFWKSVESSGDHAEYRAYLEQYTDGDFTALAKAQLAKPTAVKPDMTVDRKVELEFWTSIKDGDVAAIWTSTPRENK